MHEHAMINNEGQVAIATAFPRFNGLGRSVTPIYFSFFLMNHFLYRFYTLSEKNGENLSIRNLIFLQNAPSNSVLFSSSFICAAVSNTS